MGYFTLKSNCLKCNVILPENRVERIYCGKCSQKAKDFANHYNNQGICRTREIVRKRDNYTCQVCKKIWKKGQRRFDVHHLNGLCGKRSKKYDKVSDIDGLITLCHKCHFNYPSHSQKLSPVN